MKLFQIPVAQCARASLRAHSRPFGDFRCRARSVALACVLAVPAAIVGFAQDALTNGGNDEGTLTAGTTNLHTVAAIAGDRMVLQVAKVSGGAAFSPRIEVRTPDGTRLGITRDLVAARLDFQADQDGIHTVHISNEDPIGAGTYRLRLAQVPGEFTVPAGDDGGSMTNAANHQGAIDVGDLDLWTVQAGQGDRIVVQIAELSGGAGFTPAIELFGPDGARLAMDSGGVAARVDVQAATGGVYTVLVSDLTRVGTGTYQLRLARVPGDFTVPDGDEGGAIADGVNHEGAITVGDLDLWTFEAEPGDRVTVQITELTGGANFAPKIELFAPNGERKRFTQDASTATLDAAVETGGTYTVLVSDSAETGEGTYRLTVTRGPIEAPAANVLVSGTTYLGSIGAAGETNLWSFTASAGESIVLHMGETATGPFTPWLRLYNPGGVLLAQDFNAGAAEVTVRATNTGTFVVAVGDGTAGRNQTGNYRLGLVKTGSPLVISPTDEGGALTNGASYLATIDAGDMDAWNFTANAGESIAIWVGEQTAGSPLVPWVRLFGPDGVLLGTDFAAGAAEVTVRATNSGTFLAIVADGSPGRNQAGNYRLSLAKTGSPLAISPSDEGGAMTNGAMYLATLDVGDVDAWTFRANAGESMVVWMGETVAGSPLVPWVRLFGPDGVLLGNDFNTGAAEVTARATNSGVFTVIVGDGSAGRNQAGNYRLSMARTGGPLTISPSDEGGGLTNGATYLATLDVGDVDAWSFPANIGDSMVVWMGETVTGSPLVPWVRLFGPDGVLLANDFNAGAAEVTARATNSGVFTVIVGDGSAGRNQAGNYRLSMARTGSPLTISPSDEGGALTNGASYLAALEVGDMDPWTFSADVGENIVVRAGETAAGNLTPWLRLFSPTGVLLDGDFNAAAAEVTARATNSGVFTVIVGDGSAGRNQAGNYRLSLAKAGSPMVVSPGDEGGPMTGAGVYDGNIDTGDLDAWTFSALQGDIISFHVTELVSGSPLTPWVRLYSWNGELLRTLFNASTVQLTNFVAPAHGTYTLVVGDGSNGVGGSGTYRLTVNDLVDELKLSLPLRSGDGSVTGIGGAARGPFILWMSTNVAAPLASWTPLVSDQFDVFGIATFTNLISPDDPQRFFLLERR